jgi:hypothetical protein
VMTECSPGLGCQRGGGAPVMAACGTAASMVGLRSEQEEVREWLEALGARQGAPAPFIGPKGELGH